MFTAVSLTVARPQEQPKLSHTHTHISFVHSSTDEYIHTHAYIPKNEILPLATTWMDPEGIILNENKSERKITNTVCSYLYVESLGEKKVTYTERIGSWW